MKRPTPAYQPPTTDAMISSQNELPALRLLLAQRRLYSHAKRWSFLRWIGFSIIGTAAPILTAIAPEAAAIVGAGAGIWIFLSRTWFSGMEQRLAAKAADIQERFDQMVFRMPDLANRVPSASLEDIARLVGTDEAIASAVQKEDLKDWYPFDANVDGIYSIAIAQRANPAYSEALLRVNANMWLTITLIWSVTAIIIGFIVNLTSEQLLVGIFLPLLPALLDVWDQHRLTKQAGGVRHSMADDIENAIRGNADRHLTPEDLLIWQEQAYELRRTSPQVPNLVYKRARKRNEYAMKTVAAELAEIAVRRSAKK